MAIYRKKPVEIEAFCWTGGPDQEEDPEWAAERIKTGVISFNDGKMFIKTLEGVHQANPGDYIIKGVNGEVYPCKPDIFAKTYNYVGEAV